MTHKPHNNDARKSAFLSIIKNNFVKVWKNVKKK